MDRPRKTAPQLAFAAAVAGALFFARPFAASAQQVTLQSDDGTFEQLWGLTSPQAGPGDWIAVAYPPPFEFPFRIVSATMFRVDSSCCNPQRQCSDALCPGGTDWARRVIAHQQLAVDAGGLTPDIASPVAQQTSIGTSHAGFTSLIPPWVMSPDLWTLPAGTVFDSPGRIFYAAQYVPNDRWMRFAVDNDSPNAGTSIHTSDSFRTRSAIWSFGNVGMRITVEPIFSLKLSGLQPAPSFQLAGTASVPMLVLRVAGGNAPTTISRVRVSASGTGDDAAAISAVRLVVDTNRNGVEDPGEPTLASGTYVFAGGAVDLTFSRALPPGGDEQWLVVYDFNNTPSGGQTFTARIDSSSDVTSDLGTPFMSGTGGGTGAIRGGTVTIAGRLSAARGPASMSTQVVGAIAQDLATLQIRLTANNEAFDVSQIALTPDGTINDLTGISSVRIFDDRDSSGTLTPGDVLLATGTFSQQHARRVFSFAPVNVAANSSRDLIAVYNLSGSGAGGETFRTLLSAPTDITASGVFSGAIPLSGPRAVTGTPVIGNLATIGGALTAAVGAASPRNGTAQPGTPDVPMLQIQLAAQSEPIALTELTIQGAGTGNELTDVTRVHLYRNVHGDGVRGPDDIPIGTPQTFATLHGAVTFAFQPEVIPANGSRFYLVTYDFSGVPTGGQTYSVQVTGAGNLTASGQSSGARITAQGSFPLIGGTRTLLGGLSVSAGPQNPPPSNHQPGTADVGVLQLQVAAQGEDFTVSSVRITGSGSLPHASGLSRAAIWVDLGIPGVRDPADIFLASGTFAREDGGALLLMFNTPRRVAAATSERWLVTYDLSAAPLPGQTFRASVSIAGDVSATGSLSGAATPVGLPVTGAVQGIGGTIAIATGPANPLGGTIGPNAQHVVMAQIRLTATLERIAVGGATFTGSGSGNDLLDVAEVRLFVDVNHDGRFDPVGDVPLGTAQHYVMNHGTVSFGFAPRTIAAGASEDWIVVYTMGGSAVAGNTFRVALQSNTDISATAPSGPVPRASGAPVLGGSRTVIGDLLIARGAHMPPAATVRRDGHDVPILQLAVRGAQESFTLSALAVSARGNMDDVRDIAGITLLNDIDGMGVRTPNSVVLAGPTAFTGNQGIVTFSGLSLAIPSGATVNLLVVADLAGTAQGGTTVRLLVSAPTDVVATGLGGRQVSVAGLPVSSNTITAGGTLDVRLGAQTPPSRVIRRSLADVEAIQIRLAAGTEAATVRSVRLTAAGTGDASASIAGVDLFNDLNGNGHVDPGEPMLGSARFTMAHGTVSFPLGLNVQVGPAVHLLARMSFNAMPLGGETFQLLLDPRMDVAIGSASGGVIVDGPPISGAVLTAGGGFAVALGPRSSPAAEVNQSLQNVPLMQLDMRAVNEACTVDSLTLRAFGTLDDAVGVAHVRLFRDVNDNGVLDFEDIQLGAGQSYLVDDGTVTFGGLGRAIGMNGSERWLVVYDLSGRGSNRQTFGARVENAASVAVRCNISGSVATAGTPVESALFTVREDGALVIAPGMQSSPPAFLPATAVRASVLQLRVRADVADATVSDLALRVEAQSGAPSDTITTVELFRDLAGSGMLSRNDPLIGSGTPDARGAVHLSGLGLLIGTSEPTYLIATVNIAGNAEPGTTFRVGIANNNDVSATAAMRSVVTTGAPVWSESMTVAGHLNIQASSPPGRVSVHNDDRGLVGLDFGLVALWEAFTLRSLTITSEGTMEPARAVASLSLVADDNGNGVIDPSDRVLASGITFPEGSKRTAIMGLGEPIMPGQAKRLLVALDLAGQARLDQTIQLSIAANVDVQAFGANIGSVSPIGAPILGSMFTVGSSLEVAAGPAPPPEAIVAANSKQVPALQLVFRAFNEDVTISRIGLRAEGSLHFATDVSGVRLFIDVNRNGRVDPEDTQIEQIVRASEDGAISFTPLSERLTRGTENVYLVTLDFSGTGAAGQNIALGLVSDADVTAFGALSGAVAARGAPVGGSRISLVGALNVTLGPASPGGSGVQPGSKFPAIQLLFTTSGEAVSIERIGLRLEGTADSAVVLKGAELWQDIDGDGAVSDADRLLGSATADGNNAMLVFDSLAFSIAADSKDRLLVALSLKDSALTGGTLRVTLAQNSDVRATGRTSGAVTLVGAPLSGSAFTIVKPQAAASMSAGTAAGGCKCSAEPAAERGRSGLGLALALGLAIGAIALRRPIGRR